MSPRPEAVSEQFIDHLQEHLPSEKDLKERASKALKENKFGEVAEIAKKLEKQQGLEADLKAVGQQLTEIFRRHGVENEDIPGLAKEPEIPPLRLIEPVEEVEEEKPTTEGTYIYVENLPFATMKAIFAQDNQGNFTNQTVEAIARTILLPQHQKDKGKLQAAKRYVLQHKFTFTQPFLERAKKAGATTVEEAVEALLPKAKSQNTKDLYEIMAKQFANLSLDEFDKTFSHRFVRVTKEPEIVKPPARRRKEEKRKPQKEPDLYLPHARLLVLKYLTGRNPDGSFAYKYAREIAPLILLEHHRTNNDRLEKAINRVYNEKSAFAKGLLSFAKEKKDEGKKVTTIADIIELQLLETKNPLWRDFYETTMQIYGDLTPEDFIEKILFRPRPPQEKKGKPKTPRKEKKVIRPIDIKPEHEVVLCSIFQREQTLDQVKESLGINPDEVAKRRKAWEEEKSCKEILSDSCSKAAQLNNRLLSEADDTEGKEMVRKVIHRLLVGGRSISIEWRMIPKKYYAFRLLHALMEEIGANPKKASELEKILLAEQKVTVDTRTSLVEGVEKA